MDTMLSWPGLGQCPGSPQSLGLGPEPPELGRPQLSAESGWDGTHGGQDTPLNLGELGGAGMVGPLLCLSHCCGKGPRQVAGEPGPGGVFVP